tara:strand:+ start:1584 stop:1841 length:258 start_codon:yes stop_codon:yes gene_type:complete
MDKELQDYYENYFSLFNHAGWKQLMEDLEDAGDSFNILDVADAKALHTMQGKLHMLNQMLNWEDAISNAHENNEIDESYQATDLH